MTESLSEPQLFRWEHSGSDELCLNVEQDLGVLLVAAQLQDPPAAAQRHSCQFSVLLLEMDLTGMSAATLVCLLFKSIFQGLC